MLREQPVLREITIISGTLKYRPSLGPWPQSGDLMLLFAATWHELEELIAMRDQFEGLRLILVTGMPESSDNAQCHQLHPRYLCTMERGDLNRLGKVVARMVSYNTMVEQRENGNVL